MLAGAAALLLSTQGARCPAAPWDDMLAITPSGATMAIWADLARGRTSPAWQRFEAHTRWQTIAGCDLDADQVLVTLDEAGPTAWVLRGGASVRLERCGSLKVRRSDPRTVVLAPDRSARRFSGRARRRSPLARLLCDVPASRTAAFAATLGPEARRRLQAMPALRESATLKSVVGSADVGDGLRVWMRARLGSRRDAAKVADGIAREIDTLRRQPMMVLAGLSPVLGGVHVRAEASHATIEASVDAPALARLIQQIEVLSGTSARKP